jgi:hypothetical protein
MNEPLLDWGSMDNSTAEFWHFGVEFSRRNILSDSYDTKCMYEERRI